MKKKITTIITMLLCAILTITAISTDTAYAAEKNIPVKVTFKKKSLTVNANTEKGGIDRVKLSTLKKKWGKPSTSKSELMAEYAWKKGESEVKYVDVYEAPHSSLIYITAYDKNASVSGIKVGMSKSKAKKLLKKLGKVEEQKDGSGQLDVLYVNILDGGNAYINCYIENGKVSGIQAGLYFYE